MEKRYNPEDLDPTGRPYDDAVPIGHQKTEIIESLHSTRYTVSHEDECRGYISTFNLIPSDHRVFFITDGMGNCFMFPDNVVSFFDYIYGESSKRVYINSVPLRLGNICDLDLSVQPSSINMSDLTGKIKTGTKLMIKHRKP